MVDFLVISRERLTADRTYYVRPDGSDANVGTTNSAAAAFQTLQGACDAISSRIDVNGKKVTLQMVSPSGVTTFAPLDVPTLVGLKRSEDFVIQGDVTTPSNTVVNQSGLYLPAIQSNHAPGCTLRCMKITASGTGCFGINAAQSGVINCLDGMEFGACSAYQIYANNCGTINMFQNYKITGSATANLACALNGTLYANGITIDLTGAALTFSFGFAAAYNGGQAQLQSLTFSNTGGITGTSYRYAVQSYGGIQTFSGNASYFPGNTAGQNDGKGFFG